VDFSKFKTPDWLLVGGGLLFLIGGFLDWISVEFSGVSATGSNAFDFFFTGIVPWILIVGAGVVTVLVATGTLKAGTTPWPLVLLAATALGTLLVLLRFLFPGMGEDIPDEIDVGRAAGLWLSTIAGIVATAGAVMKFKESGGSMADLRDPDKLRGAFNRPGGPTTGPDTTAGAGLAGTTPPPPPPPAPQPPAAEPPLADPPMADPPGSDRPPPPPPPNP
jgi:hypothetical protein